jgi:hypothetical protein
MVCVTYIQQIYFFQHSFSYFIYLSYSFSSFWCIWVYLDKKSHHLLFVMVRKLSGLIWHWKDQSEFWIVLHYNIKTIMRNGYEFPRKTTYAKRKLKYSRNEHFNLLPYVEWDRFVTLTEAQAEWGLRYRIYVKKWYERILVANFRRYSKFTVV